MPLEGAAVRLLFIGEGVPLLGAIERTRELGHEIVGVFATETAEAALLSAPTAGTDPAQFVAAHPCDVLLSVNNRHILSAETLARPRLAAINYHNGPLPAYAGLRAPAWAILNGEATPRSSAPRRRWESCSRRTSCRRPWASCGLERPTCR